MVAQTPGAALEAMGEHVDLILMDVEMPDLDGPRLLPLLRSRCRAFVPCLFLTGRDDDDARQRCLEAGGDDFLSKPPRRIELQMRVASMLRIRRLTRELERRATVDPLSGVGNRGALESALDAREKERVRYRRPLALLMLDVDHFKRINDELGHAAGDHTIALLGEVLRRTTRGSDGVYRFGGEEFVVVAPETQTSGAMWLAERLRRAFAGATRQSPVGPRSLSVGVAAVTSDDPRTPRELLSAADQALYGAKTAGRDRVVLDPSSARGVGEAATPNPDRRSERPTEAPAACDAPRVGAR
ncbi:MAG: diguanylate cyclase [Polyangiales bacterium]